MIKPDHSEAGSAPLSPQDSVSDRADHTSKPNGGEESPAPEDPLAGWDDPTCWPGDPEPEPIEPLPGLARPKKVSEARKETHAKAPDRPPEARRRRETAAQELGVRKAGRNGEEEAPSEERGDKAGSRVGAGTRTGGHPNDDRSTTLHSSTTSQASPLGSSSDTSSSSSSLSSGCCSLWLTTSSDEESGDALQDHPSDALVADLRAHLGDECATQWVRRLRGLYNFGPVTDLRKALRIRHREVVWSWESWQIEKAPIPKRVHEAILRFACGDPILRRYVTFCLVSAWRDEGTGELCFPWQAAAWVYCGDVSRKRLYDKTTEDGIHSQADLVEYLKGKFPGELETREHIRRRRVTLLKETGLPTELVELHREELSKETGEAVQAGDGTAFDPKATPARLREELEARVARMHFPSPTATLIADHLNALPAKRFTRQFHANLDEARAYVKEMEIDVELSEDKLEGLSLAERAREQEEANEEQRGEYLKILKHIEHQAKPFYRPSRSGRTDRIFSCGRSVLILPGSVRKILSKGLYEVDLISAHLILAAWLWGATDVLERLTAEDFDLWQTLIGHFEEEITERFGEMLEKGSELWEDVKAALKIALYSTVYGMYAPSVKAKFTRRMKGLLGKKTGEKTGIKLGRHPLIAELLKARDEQLARLKVGDTLTGPTGIRVKIMQPMDSDEDGVDAKSAMATIAQSCEQYLMEAILDYIAELDAKTSRRHMRLYLWLHDGAYLKLRSPRACSKGLQKRLARRAEELKAWAEASDHWQTGGAPPVAFDIDKL